MKIVGDDVIFNSGKKRYANLGIIGIGREDDEIFFSEGYDGRFWSPWLDKEDAAYHLTEQELIELVNYLMNLLHEFKMKLDIKET